MTEAPESGNCFNCSEWVSSEFYCYGCKEFICDGEDCEGAIGWSVAAATGHGHEPEDHFIEFDEDEDL